MTVNGKNDHIFFFSTKAKFTRVLKEIPDGIISIIKGMLTCQETIPTEPGLMDLTLMIKNAIKNSLEVL